MSAAYSIRTIERGKVTKGKDKGKNNGRAVDLNVFNEH